MKALAQLAFDHLWLMQFADEEVLDPDYAVALQESVEDYLAAFTPDEKAALSAIARETQARLLAEPDAYGYSPRKTITAEQKAFLASLVTGELFDQWT